MVHLSLVPCSTSYYINFISCCQAGKSTKPVSGDRGITEKLIGGSCDLQLEIVTGRAAITVING